MVQVDITKAISDVLKGYSNLTRQQINGAVSRAMNHVIAVGRTAASREIRTIYKIKPKYLGSKGSGDQESRNSAIKVKKANINTLQAAILASGRPLPLVAFPTRQTRKGINVQIFAGQSKVLPGAFMATMKSGHIGVFARGKYAGGKFASRRKREKPWPQTDTQITELTTASVPHAFLNKAVIDATTATIKAKFGARFDHEVGRLFR